MTLFIRRCRHGHQHITAASDHRPTARRRTAARKATPRATPRATATPKQLPLLEVPPAPDLYARLRDGSEPTVEERLHASTRAAHRSRSRQRAAKQRDGVPAPPSLQKFIAARRSGLDYYSALAAARGGAA